MAHRFDSALLNRERDRLLLAEALESKYATERRRSSFTRLLLIGAVAGFGYYASQGFSALTPDRPPVLTQVKKQLDEGSTIVIGAPVVEIPRNQRVSPEPRNFVAEKIPPNLYGDLRRGNKPPARAPEYLPAGGRLLLDWTRLQSSRNRHVPFVCANYSPARPEDLRKLPPAAARAYVPPSPFLYARVNAVPPALASDLRAFPTKP